MSMIDDIHADVKDRMDKAVQAMVKGFTKIRTGRATPALLDGLMADYYGTATPLTQMGSITAPEPRLLLIQPWDAQAIGEIEKAVLKSELGLTPQNDGKIIRIGIPTLTYMGAIRDRLQVMDTTAFSLAMENRIPLLVFNLFTHGNIKRALRGEPVGTLVTE